MAQRAFACPKCKTKLTAPDGVERLRCPKCKTILTAPSAPPAPAAPQAPTPAPPPAPAPQATAPAAPPPPAPKPQAPAPAAPAPAAPAAPPPAPAAASKPAAREVACPKCKTKLNAPEGVARFRCPRCKTILSAPTAAPAPAPAAVPVAAPPPAPAPAPEPDALEGHDLGGYHITRVIGRGGMGTVYEAIQEGLKRRVALKVLPPSSAHDTAFLTSFKREAQATAKLNHPNIIQIFDIVESEGHQFFSMEFVDGESLSARLERQGRIPAADALEIVAQVAAALDHANEHMLIHRDIKPANILLTQRGDVKLADLGLSKSLEETTIGVVRGTHGGPIYMAPEFAQNPKIADCRSDIYALGAVLFHAVTGQPPFPGPTAADLIRQHAVSPLPSARTIAPDLPEPMDALLQKMCAKDPASRFQTHGELLAEVQLLLKATAVRKLRIPAALAATERKPSDRSWLPIAIGAAAIVLLALAAILIIPRLRGKPAKAAAAPSTATAADSTDDIEPAAPEDVKPDDDDDDDEGDESAVVPPPADDEPDDAEEEETEKPKDDGDDEPDEGDEEAKPDEPKDDGEEKADDAEEENEEPEAPAWQEAFAKAQDEASKLADDRKFGKALATLDALTKANDDADLAEAVADARQAINLQAAQAFAAARTAALGLAAKGKFPEAAAALQNVIDTFGTEREAQLAQAALASLAKYQQSLKALGSVVKQAAAAAKAAQARAAAQASLAKALGPVHTLMGEWMLDDAVAKLAALKVSDPKVAAQIAQHKAAAQALRDLREKMIQRIKTAKPRLRKGDLRIRGLNGDLIDADADGITIKTPMKTEKLPWAKLRDVSAKALARRSTKQSDPADLLGTAMLLRLYDDEAADSYLDRANALGAKTSALANPEAAAKQAATEAQAARSLLGAVTLLARGQHAKAATAVAAYKKKYSDTEHYAAHKKLIAAALAFKPFAPPAPPKPTAAPKKPGPKKPTPAKPKPKPKPRAAKVDPKALAQYRKTVAAYNSRNFDECKDLLAELKDQFPKSSLLTNRKLKPSVATMAKTIAAQGPRLTVGRGGHRNLKAALTALEKPGATIEIQSGSYTGGGTLSGDNAQGLSIRGTGDRNPRLDGGSGGRTILKLMPGVKKVWIGGLTFQRSKVAIDIDQGCSATIRDCFALKDVGTAIKVGPESAVSLANSVLKIDGLNGTTATDCAFLCGNTTIDYSRLTRCVLVGKDIAILGSTLTDCLIIGSVRIGNSAVLNHVTITKPATVERDIRRARVSNSILHSLEFEKIDLKKWKKMTKEEKERRDEAVNVSLTNCVLFRHRDDLPDIIVKAKDVEMEKVAFANPTRRDFRLADNSPHRGAATDKTDLGCRLTPDMLKLLKYLRR